MTDYSTQQIVFIDSRVPDIQDLLAGLQPGEKAFVIDASSDGVQQIANILAANNLTNLASISIVSHGETGEIELGSSFIADGNLASHSNALAEIGAALAPGGNIQLYGCDVAQGATGQQFIDDFSTYAGGVTVEAATHMVGSNGGWTLDASSTGGSGSADPSGSTANGAPNPPFTAAALKSFQGELATPTTEIWAAVGGQPQIVHADDTGNGTAANATSLYQLNANFTQPIGIGLDPNQQKYFLLNSGDGGPSDVLVGSLQQAVNSPSAAPTFTTITLDGDGNNFVPEIQLDTIAHQIYFVDVRGFNSGTSETSVLERVNYDGTGLTTLGTIVSGTNGGVVGFALDPVNHNAVFEVNQGGFISSSTVTPASAFLYEATGLTASATSASISQLPIDNDSTVATSLGFFTQNGGIAIDPNTQMVYFTLEEGSSGTAGGLYKYSLVGNPTGSFSAVYQETSTTQPIFNAIAIDPATGKWYGASDATGQDEIWSGSLSGGAPSTFLTFSNESAGPEQMALDNAPTISFSAGNPTFTESTSNPASSNNTPVALGASPGDPDGGGLVSATVTIGGLFVGDVLSADVAGTSISASYNASTGVLSLSGLDSLANYQSVLSSVTFTSTSDNPTDYGSHNSRVVTWTVNDGLLDSAPQTETVTVVGVNDPPTLTGTGNASFTENGSAVTLSGAAAVSDPDSLTLASATVAVTGGTFTGDGDVLGANVTGTSITASYNAATETLTLTGSDTLAHYQQVLDSVTFVTPSDNPDDHGLAPTRTVTWTLNDGSASNATMSVTTTVGVAAVNDPPTLSGTTNASFTENGSPVTLSGAASVSDPDNLNLASATVAVTGGTFAGDGDVLGANVTGTSISASYNAATETLVLSGSDTLAHYQQVLDSVAFVTPSDNPTNFGVNPTRTVTWTLNDGSASTATTSVTTTVNVTAVNDAPTLAGTANASFIENGPAVTLSGAASVSDPDNLNLAGATVAITGGTFGGDGDVLSATVTGTAITASYNAATETLTLAGSDTLAHYQQVLDSVTFVTPSDNPDDFGLAPTRTVTWTLNDGSASNATTSVTTTVGITAVNDAPTLSGTGNASFTENGSPVTLSGGASVSDPDSLNLASATVAITGGTFAGDGDVLGANVTGTSITASYNAATETLALSGADTLAHYQQVLDSVTFVTPSDNPSDYGSAPTRTVTWTLNDGSASNATTSATTTVNVTAVNDAPTLAGTANASFTENGPAVTLSGAASVSDPDNLNLASATVAVTGGTFAGDGDVLGANVTGTAITASYNAATETLTLTGSDTPAHYQQVLDSVTFVTPSDNPDDFGLAPTRTVTWTLNDGSASNATTSVTTTVGIAAVNDAPTLAGTANASFTENGPAVTLSGAASVSDPDNLNLAGATVAITGGTFAGDGDVLSATVTGTAITASYNAATETLTLTGSDTLAHYQQVLDSVTFVTPSDNPDDFGLAPTRTVTWTLNDGSASNATTSVTTTVNVTAVNDAPTLAGTANASFTENGPAVTLSGAASVSDPDSLNLASATVAITGGTFAGDGDVLGANTAGTGITASYNAATETLTLTGSDTLAHYQQVLDSVTFVTPSDNPDDFGSAPTRTVTWTLNDGSASNATTSVTTTVGITAVNDAPTLSGTGNASFTENGSPVTLSGGASVSDPDSLNLASATVAITGGTFAGDGDVLGANVTGTSITASYNVATETLALSGADTLAHYQQVLDSVTFVTPSDNPSDYGSAPTRTVTWTLNDGSASNATTSVTTTVGITAVNDPPTLSGVATSASYTEQAAATTLSGGLAVSDPDSLTLAHATVKIVGGTFAGDGDVLGANTAGTAITASYNAATETLVLSGVDSVAHYRSVLDSVTFFDPSDNPTDFGSNTTRTLAWVVDDGSASNNTSNAATTTLNVTALNDPPTLAGVPSADSFSVGQTLIVAPALAVSDPDNLTLASATVRVTSGTFAGDGDVLGANVSGTGITASYSAATETLTLTGSDTLAHYQQVLDSVTFTSGSNPTNSGLDPTRTLSWTVNDGSGSNNTATASTTISISAPLVKNDFNGDRTSDIVFQDGIGLLHPVEYLMNGTSVAAQATLPSPGIGWHIVGSGDFNSDGKADILWQNIDGTPMIWTMNGSTVTSETTLSDPGLAWRAVGTGDFNGDGKSDILFQNINGTPMVWAMNGTSVASTTTLSDPGPTWKLVGTGDFNGDGKSDLVFQSPNGTPQIWLMNGTSVTATATLPKPSGAGSWHLVGTGDFNGDGDADLLFQKANGTPMIWTMNGTSVTSTATLANPGAAWSAIGTGDYNGDGKSDILFQKNDGTPMVWTMSGTSVTATATLPNPGVLLHANSG